jgi:hypothetical protein
MSNLFYYYFLYYCISDVFVKINQGMSTLLLSFALPLLSFALPLQGRILEKNTKFALCFGI